MTDSEYNALVRHMRTQRTLSPQEVERRTQEHDSNDFTAQERRAQFGA